MIITRRGVMANKLWCPVASGRGTANYEAGTRRWKWEATTATGPTSALALRRGEGTITQPW